MGDVEVAIDDLQHLARRLRDLSGDMTGQDADVSYSRRELVHSTVINAMEEFHDNWDNNRGYVSEKLVDLADMAEQTADGFDETDAELARQINEVTADL